MSEITNLMAEVAQERKEKAFAIVAQTARKPNPTKADLRKVLDAADDMEQSPRWYDVFRQAIEAHTSAKAEAAEQNTRQAALNEAATEVQKAEKALAEETVRLEAALEAARGRYRFARTEHSNAVNAATLVRLLEQCFAPLFDASLGIDRFALPSDISSGATLPPAVLQAMRDGGLLDRSHPVALTATRSPVVSEADEAELARRRQELREQHARLMFHLDDRAAPQATSAFTRESL